MQGQRDIIIIQLRMRTSQMKMIMLKHILIMMIIGIIISSSNFLEAINASQCDVRVASSQPTLYESLIRTYGVVVNDSLEEVRSFNVTAFPLLYEIIHPDRCQYSSQLNISEAIGIPSTQGWSRCLWCGWKDGKVLLRETTTGTAAATAADATTATTGTEIINEKDFNQKYSLTWSQWGEFFHHNSNDQYEAILESRNHHFQPKYLITRPVYILPMITFHVGHILIDVIEQLYHNMMFTYGTIRRDTILIIDVAGLQERNILQRKLNKNIEIKPMNEKMESIAIFLKIFTSFPIFSIELLNELNDLSYNHNEGKKEEKEEGIVVFSDIHFGFDQKKSFFHYGSLYSPCILPLGPREQFYPHMIKNSYQNFYNFLHNYYNKKYNFLEINYSWNFLLNSSFNEKQKIIKNQIKIKKSIKVLIIQRTKNRILLNIHEIINKLQLENKDFINNIDIKIIDFNKISFLKQLILLNETDIFISIAGTSLHNLLFLSTNITKITNITKSVIIIMQSRWCSFSWMYANQAILLHIQPFIYCINNELSEQYPEELDVPPITWNRTQQMKIDDYDINPNRFLYFQWSRKFWLQGPRYTKSENVTLHYETFFNLFSEVINYMEKMKEQNSSLIDSNDNSSSDSSSSTDSDSTSSSDSCSDSSNDNTSSTGSDSTSSSESDGGVVYHASENMPICSGYRKTIQQYHNLTEEKRIYNEICNSFSLRKSRIAEMYISEVSVSDTPIMHQNTLMEHNRRITLMGEIALAQRDLRQTAESFPRISVCFRTLPAVDHYSPPIIINSEGEFLRNEFILAYEEINDYELGSVNRDRSWHVQRQATCYPFSILNYYSNLHFDVGSTIVLSLHVWAQSSPSGGKLKGSDTFLSLDCRLEDCGFTLPDKVRSLVDMKSNISEYIEFDVDIYSHCTQNISFIDGNGNIDFQILKAKQIVSFPTQQVESSPSMNAEHPVDYEKKSTYTFKWRISSTRSLQRYMTDFCHCNSLTSANCGVFVTTFLRFLSSWYYLQSLHSIPTSQQDHVPLPLIQLSPTPQHPFFFVHIEKTAGTSLREFIFESAEKRKLLAYIPCHDSLPCQTFALPVHREENDPSNEILHPDRPLSRDLQNISIVAGHFGWGAWRELPQCTKSINRTSSSISYRSYHLGFNQLSCQLSCFTMARHPVQRSISYYYQRLYTSIDSIGYQRRLQDLTVEELIHIIKYERTILPSGFVYNTSIYIDEGLSNGACRMMLNYENRLTGKSVHPKIRDDTKEPSSRINIAQGRRSLEYPLPNIGNQTEYFDEELVNAAIFNMKHCVIGLQEYWIDSLKMINHWFPWIDTSKDPYRRKLLLFKGQETHELLREERRDLYDVLVEYNNCDMMLHEEMIKRYEQQVEYLQNLKF